MPDCHTRLADYLRVKVTGCLVLREELMRFAHSWQLNREPSLRFLATCYRLDVRPLCCPGMPLYEAVNLIRKKRSELSCVEVKYATQVWYLACQCTQQPPTNSTSLPQQKWQIPHCTVSMRHLLLFQALFDQDIVINFPEHGMHLRFEARSQRLRLVEVYDLSRLQVSLSLVV